MGLEKEAASGGEERRRIRGLVRDADPGEYGTVETDLQLVHRREPDTTGCEKPQEWEGFSRVRISTWREEEQTMSESE